MKKKLHSLSTNYQSIFVFCFALLLNVGLVNSQTEIAVNGGFETGDFTGWTQITSGTQAVVTTNPSEGASCAQLNNNVPASASLIKNANIGIGTVSAGQNLTITFDARGTLADGGVAFAEFFSELSGGGVSSSVILGGGPLALDPDPNTWKSFSFTTTTGPDVSGGVTLQLTATTGGAGTSVANMFYDNISVTEATPSARVQVIHNSADALASVVDVYLDGVLTIDDFSFRTASPFIDVPAGTPISVAVAPSNSTSVGDAIATFPYTLIDGETYVLVAEGIVSPSGYSPATAFDIAVYPMGRETAGTSGNTDLLVHHGSTDAPTVDVNEVSGPSILVDDISYGEFDPNGYLELPTADYTINISTADGVTVVADYDAPLATLGLGNAAAVVVASGFLDPSVNSNGPAFGLWVALPSGGALVELPPGGSTPTQPIAAPTPPSIPAISIISDVFTNIVVPQVDTFGSTLTNFDLNADTNEEARSIIDGSGFQFNWFPGSAFVDISNAAFLHVDFYCDNLVDGDVLRIRLLDPDPGANGANIARATFQAAQSGSWVSLDLELPEGTNLNDFGDIDSASSPVDLTQLSLIQFNTLDLGSTLNTKEVYLSNIYFYGGTLSTSDAELYSFKTYPNPTQDSWTIETQNVRMSSITVYDVLGKSVMSMTPNEDRAVIDGSSLKSGLYFAKVETDEGTSSVKLVKN